MLRVLLSLPIRDEFSIQIISILYLSLRTAMKREYHEGIARMIHVNFESIPQFPRCVAIYLNGRVIKNIFKFKDIILKF